MNSLPSALAQRWTESRARRYRWKVKIEFSQNSEKKVRKEKRKVSQTYQLGEKNKQKSKRDLLAYRTAAAVRWAGMDD